MYEIHTHCVCTCFCSFAIEVIAEGGVKSCVVNSRSLWSTSRDADILYTCHEQRKEIVLVDYILHWQISMYVRDMYISVYMCMKGKQEGWKEVDTLWAPNTDTDFCCMLEIKNFSAHMEGRKEMIVVNYPLQLQITTYRLVPTTDSSLAIPFFVVPDLVLLQSLFLCFKLCPLYLF